MRVALMVAGGMVVGAVVPASRAQETITFQLAFEHAVLAPGQAQTVRVAAFLEPGIGAPAVWNTLGGSGQVGTVAGFAYATFTVLDELNAHTGTWSDLQVNPILLGSQGTVLPGGSSVLSILAWNILTLNSQNPLPLWSARWTPQNYDSREVRLRTAALELPRAFLSLPQPSHPVEDEWAPIGTSRAFQVIPAPASAAALFILLLAPRRRRAGGVKEKT